MITFTKDLLAMIQSIRDIDDEPDETSMLALADAIQEHGDDHRAELIRVQMGLNRLPPPPIVIEECIIDKRLGPNYYSLSGGEDVRGGDRLINVLDGDEKRRVDILRPKALFSSKGYKPLYGLRFYKELEDELIFIKDEHSKPWTGWDLLEREKKLLEDSSILPQLEGSSEKSVAALAA